MAKQIRRFSFFALQEGVSEFFVNDGGWLVLLFANLMLPHETTQQPRNFNDSRDTTAICRQEGGAQNYLFSTSYDGRVWTQAEPRDWVPNGISSKPTFDKFAGVYHMGWQEATRVGDMGRSVFNVDVSTDCLSWQRTYRFESPMGFQYPFFAEHNGAVWFTVTQGRAERILFGKLEDLTTPAVHPLK